MPDTPPGRPAVLAAAVPRAEVYVPVRLAARSPGVRVRVRDLPAGLAVVVLTEPVPRGRETGCVVELPGGGRCIVRPDVLAGDA